MQNLMSLLRLVRIIVSFSLAFSPLACGRSSAPPPTAGESAEIALYTSVPEAAIPAIKTAFESAHPGLTLRVVRAGTEKLLDRINLEAAGDSPSFDVAWLSDFTAAESLCDRRLFAPYAVPEPDAIAPMFRDPDGYYAGSRVMCMTICYNTAKVSGSPSSYAQLTSPEFRGRIGVADPHTSGASFSCVATLMKTPDFGWEYFKRLYDNGAVIAADNADLLKRIAAGELAAGLVLDNQVRDFKKAHPAATVEYRTPVDGMALVVSPIAVSARSPHQRAATVFVDWVLSREGQALLAEQTSTIPVRNDVRAGPESDLGNAKILIAAPSVMNSQKDRILAAFDAIFAGKPIDEIHSIAD